MWLKFHDDFFLDRLVKVFGYVQDKDLLKWVLDGNLNEDEFEKLIYTKTCANKLVFHKQVFEVMIQADAKSKKKHLLFLKGRIDFPKLDDINFSDATKILALYCYYATKLSMSIEPSYVYSFFQKLEEKNMKKNSRKTIIITCLILKSYTKRPNLEVLVCQNNCQRIEFLLHS